jgi:hypothetical protein
MIETSRETVLSEQENCNDEIMSYDTVQGTLVIDGDYAAAILTSKTAVYIAIWSNISSLRGALTGSTARLLYAGNITCQWTMLALNTSLTTKSTTVLHLAAASRFDIGRWEVSMESVSHITTVSERQIFNITIDAQGLYLATVELGCIVIRDASLSIIHQLSLDISADTSTRLCFHSTATSMLICSVDTTLYLWSFTIAPSQTNHVVYDSTGLNTIIAISQENDDCYLGYTNGQIVHLRIMTVPDLTIIELCHTDLSKETRYLRDLSAAVTTHDCDPLCIQVVGTSLAIVTLGYVVSLNAKVNYTILNRIRLPPIIMYCI